MLRISNFDDIVNGDVKVTIPKLVKKIMPILEKRRRLHEIYSNRADDSRVMFSNDEKNTVVTYEKFLTDIASGYLSGRPIYSVSVTQDEEKQKLLNELLDKPIHDDNYKEAMQIIIDHVTGYNDDETEHHDLVHDILEMTGAYEVLYENENNEIVYSKYDPLTTVATWDYNIPANLTGIIRVWEEKDINDKITRKCEITDINGSRTYSMTDNYEEVIELDNNNHNWGDVPAIAVENDFAIFEPCEDVISAFQQLIQNIRNTFQYNDTDCKLKFSNYLPEEPIFKTIYETNDKGEEVPKKELNEKRIQEDEMLFKAKTLYVQENGDVDWITKPLDSTGAVEILKIYTNLMFQLAGIPNTADLAFNSADLNASAIDRKFYIMNMMTANVISQLKKAYQRRWELIFNRINLKKGTMFDFRDIDIELPKNLPANDDEKIDSTLKLQNILSMQTLIERLGFDYLDEKNKKEAEASENILINMEHMKMLGGDTSNMSAEVGFEDSSNVKSADELYETKKAQDEEKAKEEAEKPQEEEQDAKEEENASKEKEKEDTKKK